MPRILPSITLGKQCPTVYRHQYPVLSGEQVIVDEGHIICTVNSDLKYEQDIFLNFLQQQGMNLCFGYNSNQ